MSSTAPAAATLSEMDRQSPGLAVAAALGRQLRTLGYDEAHVRARLRGRLIQRTTPAVVAVAQRRAGSDALGSAIGFWHLGVAAGQNSIEEFLGDVPIADLETIGLVERHGDAWVASVAISPFEHLLVANDADDGTAMTADHVLGVGAATRTLASLTPPGSVERALDIGTGGGVQALLARSHAQEVVATDLAERAVWMAGLSAALSGIDGIDIRLGDRLEPVAGETFDLIVCNPPFVISPDRDLTFRDSGSPADGISRELVRDVVPLLRPDGTACILVNWIVRSGSSVTDVPREWVADLGCDALVLHHDTLDPIGYADRWAMVPAAASPATHGDALGRWLAYFEELDASAIASGAIILRKRDGESRAQVAEMPKRPRNGGEQVERMLAAMGRFDGPEDPALGSTVFRLAHGHRVEQRLSYGHTRYEARDAVLRLDRSAGVLATMPADLLEALFLIDGERTIAGIAGEVAEAREVSVDELRVELDPAILRLHQLGFLEVSELE